VAKVFGHPDEMTAQVFPKLTLVTVNSCIYGSVKTT